MPIRVVSVQDTYAQLQHQTIKILVAGSPGSGKTRTASTWPNVLYADVEGRLLSVRDRNVHSVHIDGIPALEELKTILDQEEPVRDKLLGTHVETVVIDTVDEVARLVIKERLRSERIEAMRVQDWGYLADTLRNLLRAYRNLKDLNVIFNVHLKSTEDGETGRVEYKPAIQGAVGDEIAGYVDEAFLLLARPTSDPRTGDRIIARHFQTYPDAQHDWCKDHSGSIPLEFPVNFEDDYERLAYYIFSRVPAPASTPVEPVAPPATEPAPERVTAKATKAAKIMATTAAPATTEGTTLTEVAPEPATGNGKVVDTEPPVRKKGSSVVKAAVVDVELPPEPVEKPAPSAVPEEGTELPDDDPLADLGNAPTGTTCSECGVVIDPPDYAEFSEVRFGVPLCRVHFTARNKRKPVS